MVTLALAMALSRLFFMSLILFPVLAHWMLAMALSGLFSWASFLGPDFMSSANDTM